MDDSVEGHSASGVVHIDGDSPRIGGRDGGEVQPFVIVEDRVTAVRTQKAPRLLILSKLAVETAAMSPDLFVCHRNANPSCPLHLPVTATS